MLHNSLGLLDFKPIEDDFNQKIFFQDLRDYWNKNKNDGLTNFGHYFLFAIDFEFNGLERRDTFILSVLTFLCTEEMVKELKVNTSSFLELSDTDFAKLNGVFDVNNPEHRQCLLDVCQRERKYFKSLAKLTNILDEHCGRLLHLNEQKNKEEHGQYELKEVNSFSNNCNM